MRRTIAGCATVALLIAGSARGASHKSAKDVPAAWDRIGAAAYLDSREQWWLTWPKSQRDHETACISCHTAVPYAMARPALHNA